MDDVPKAGDNIDRNSPLLFFNLAESYWLAAAALNAQNVRSTHRRSPVSFLYYHAIELYLKSFLRLHGHSAKELRGKQYGHRTFCLSERAAKLGLHIEEHDAQVFSLMSCTDAVIRSRYVETGFYHWPEIDSLDRTCRTLRLSVGHSLKAEKIPVRL